MASNFLVLSQIVDNFILNAIPMCDATNKQSSIKTRHIYYNISLKQNWKTALGSTIILIPPIIPIR